jgi:CubicO group peptidase (beta-lactamase class C family)
MLLNNGELDGKRILSEASIKEMSRKQTAENIKDSYGLGCAVGDGWFGHGGALATNMNVDTKRGLVTVWMVQHNGFPGDGGKAQGRSRPRPKPNTHRSDSQSTGIDFQTFNPSLFQSRNMTNKIFTIAAVVFFSFAGWSGRGGARIA